MIGIGIDTGGTYTDAVLYDMNSRTILGTGKTLTTRQDLKICIARVLDELDPELVAKAGLLALSTTLATNASLENKGSRARCLMIGCEPDKMRSAEAVYASYGLTDMSDLIFVKGKPVHAYTQPEEPDWEEIRTQAGEWFAGCGAAAVTQIFPRADGGALERKARDILREQLDVPVTVGSELFDDIDVLRRGAGTLLNARLVPLIDEFLEAVHGVLKERSLSIPIAIVRSDGSLMSESMTRDVPVETLLSGPAASVVGGSTLSGEPDAVIVDMGGTTTDVALMRGTHPLTAEEGIVIGPWQTMVHGLYVDTFLLGGDSEIVCRDGDLAIEGRRVIPLSVLAGTYPEVTTKLTQLAETKRRHTRPIHEFYVLQRTTASTGYTQQELRICEALQDHPLMMEELAEAIGSEIYFLNTERLEAEGIIMRSGLTPTDMMVLKGDFTGMVSDAARAGAVCLARSLGLKSHEKKETQDDWDEWAREIADEVYRLVQQKMYMQLCRILLEQKVGRHTPWLKEEGVQKLIAMSFEEARAREAGLEQKPVSEDGTNKDWAAFACTTDLPIIGVGAPIHIFLPEVARMLGTRAIICDHAPVANALGAIAGRIAARVRIRVKAEYVGAEFKGYSVYEGEERHMFHDYEEAEAFARSLAVREASDKACRQGAAGTPQVQVQVRQIRSRTGEINMFFESIVEAIATDQFGG